MINLGIFDGVSNKFSNKFLLSIESLEF